MNKKIIGTLAAAWNRESGRTMRVYVNSNYGGAYDSIPATIRKDLVKPRGVV